MFSLQTPNLVLQIRGHLPDPVVSALESTLGNGAQSLEHRGPVTIAIDGNYLPSIGPVPRGGAIPRNCDGTAQAALTAVNQAGRFSGLLCKSSCVDHGLAFRAIGPAQFDEARIDQLYVNEIRTLCGTLIAKGGEDSGGGDPGETPTGLAKYNVLRFRVTNSSPVPGNTSLAFANLLTWQSGAYGNGNATVVVIDYTPTSEFSNRWRNGFRGYCIQKQDRKTIVISGSTYPCYEVLWVESYARWIEFRLTTNVSGGQAEGTVLRYWGCTAGQSPGTTVLLKDRLGKVANGRIGYRGIAVHDEIEKEYVIIADETPGITSLPLEETTKCVKIRNGKRKDQCVYDGLLVEPGNLAGMCEDGAFNTVTSVWLFIPNFRTDVNSGTYHWGKLIRPEFDVDGDVRPLFYTGYDPDDFVTLRIQSGAAKNEDCLYPAKVVKFNYDAAREGEACDISPEDGDDVEVFMPNFGPCLELDKDVYLLARRVGADTYVSLEGFHDDCAQLAVIGTANYDFDCATPEVQNTVTESPGVDPHLFDQGVFAGDLLTTWNTFHFCGKPGSKVLTLIGHNPGVDVAIFGHGLQFEHACLSPSVAVSPSGVCNLQNTRMPISLPVCGESETRKVDLSAVVCDCPCDGQSGDCECFGSNDVVSATLRFTGTRVCPQGSEAVVTKSWNITLNFNPANGWHEGTFTTTDSYPTIYYIVLYHCGNEPIASRTGFVVFDCNIPRPEGPFDTIFDEDGLPTPGNCQVDLFTWDRTNPFVFSPDDCAACTRTYRVRVKCLGMNVQPDGSVLPDIQSQLAVLHQFEGNSVPDEIGLGAVTEGGCNSAVLENFVSVGWGTGAPGYENHVFAGFTSGSGTTTLNW